MYEWHDFGGGGFMLIFWILIIVAIVWVVKAVAAKLGASAEKPGSAIELLKERYAKGEIEREEFEQKRKDLND
ncbi:MAG: putative membrane protein [Gammaproteobacteria bacterium]|jgi:putative membrane protein